MHLGPGTDSRFRWETTLWARGWPSCDYRGSPVAARRLRVDVVTIPFKMRGLSGEVSRSSTEPTTTRCAGATTCWAGTVSVHPLDLGCLEADRRSDRGLDERLRHRLGEGVNGTPACAMSRHD